MAVSLDGLSDPSPTRLAVQVADHHRLRRQVVVGDAARLDHHQLRPGNPGGHVARGPGDQVVAHELGVQRADRLAQRLIQGFPRCSAPASLACAHSSEAAPRLPVARRSRMRAQPVHDLVRPAPEIVVQPHVLGVQLVVHVRAGRVRPVDVPVDPAHGGRRGRHVRVGARGDRRVDGRTQRRPLPGPDHAERAPGDVRVDLHERRALDQAARHHELGHRHARGAERVDDHPGAERGRLEQRPVDLRRGGGQRQAHDGAGQAGRPPAPNDCRPPSPARSARARPAARPWPSRPAAAAATRRAAGPRRRTRRGPRWR